MSKKYIALPRILELTGMAADTGFRQDLEAAIAETAENETDCVDVGGTSYVEHAILDKIAYEWPDQEAPVSSKLYDVFAQIEAEEGDLPQPPATTSRRRRPAASSETPAESTEPAASSGRGRGRGRPRNTSDSDTSSSETRISQALEGVPNDNPAQEPSKVIETPSQARTRALADQSKGYGAVDALEEAAIEAEIVACEARLKFLQARKAATQQG